MTHLQRIATTLIVLALLLSACQPVMPEAQSAPEAPHGLRPDAPPYAVHGPYAVGVHELEIEDGDHTVFAAIWYPALNLGGSKEEITYTATDFKSSPPSTTVTQGQAIQDAAPDMAQGPYPLVVFGPGLAGWRHANAYLLEHLASHGFVAMAWDPRGETFEEFWAGAATRQLDTNLLIAYADQLTAPSGDMAGLIDTEHIAVAGHSSGGWSALTGGGAQMDWGWCAANPEIVAENDLSNCTQFVPHQEEIAAMLGQSSVPEGIWPPTHDPRVDAIVALAPDGDIWGADYQGVANVKVPTLIMAGSNDTINIPERCAYPIYEHLGSPSKSLIVFQGGDHMIFFSQCRDIPWMMTELFWACSDAVWNMDRAHDLVNHFTTAFLLAELKGDADAVAALAPENVTFPGIQYETTAYASAASVPATTPALDAETVAEIETYVVDKLSANGIPGLALGVMVDGALVYEQGFGVASLDSQEPVTPETVFLLGETTMAPTAIAILQLVEQGVIDLDAPITDYLPYFVMDDEYFGEITVRHMLAHRSGISDSGDAMADWSSFTPEFDVGSTERWVRSLADRSLLFRPGTGFEYSDIAYAILGDVIAKVTNQPFEVYMQQKLFAPLGMAHSTYLMDEVDPNLLASPHIADGADGRMVSDVFPYHRPFASANNLFSNVEDMARLSSAVLNGGVLDDARILSAASHEAMWTAYSPTPYADYAFGIIWPATLMMDYGYGWFIGESNGHTVYTAFGRELGFNGQMILSPDGNMAVIAMGNGPVLDAYYASDIATDVMGMMIDSMAGAR